MNKARDRKKSVNKVNLEQWMRTDRYTFDIIYERFIRIFRESLSDSLQKIATVSIVNTETLKFGEYVNGLPIPVMIEVLKVESAGGPGLLVMENKLSYALVDSYLGGTDRPYSRPEGKEFTKIERALLQIVVNHAIKDLNEAWSPVQETEISAIRMEVNPQFAGIVPPSETVISTTFEVELENDSGTLNLVLPESTLAPIQAQLGCSPLPVNKPASRAAQIRDPGLKTELERARKRLTEVLSLCDARTLANYFVNEHPQTISAILAFATPEKRGDVLRRLLEEVQTEVVVRICNLDRIPPRVFVPLADLFVSRLEYLVGVFEVQEVGGVKAIVDTMNSMDPEARQSLMARVEERDPQLAEDIRKLAEAIRKDSEGSTAA